jgi:hypothetical protein
MGHTDFLRVDEQGQEEWVSCGLGDTLVAPLNALHAFHNRTDEPSRFISSSVQLATQDEVPLWLILGVNAEKVIAEIAITAIGTNQPRSAKSWGIGKVDSTNREPADRRLFTIS